MRSALLANKIAQWSFRDAAVDVDFVRKRAAMRGKTVLFTDAVANTRTSIGMAQWNDGHWQTFVSGGLRLTDKGALSEGTATNVCLWSRDFTNAAWTKTSITAALDQTGIDNTANSASSLLATGANGTVTQAITIAGATQRTSLFLKRITGSGQILVSADNFSTTTDVTASLSTTAWFRIDFASTANPTLGIKIVTNADKIAVDCAQQEVSAFSTSPIVTTTVSVARSGDFVMGATVSNAAAVANLTATSLYSAFTYHDTAAAAGLLNVGISGNNNEMTRIVASSGDLANIVTVSVGSTIANVTATGAMVEGTIYKIAAAAAATDYAVCKSGGTVGTAATAGALPATLTGWAMGLQGSGSGQPYGYTQRIAIWSSIRKTNNELQGMTA